MAHIALIGATGQAGTCILQELSHRGHSVTAISRHSENIALLENVTAKSCDVNDVTLLTSLLEGHDAVVSAVKFSATDPHNLIKSVKGAGVMRYLVVGGAASLLVSPGNRLIDQPDFPDVYKPEAILGVNFLEVLRGEKELNWVFLSPSANFTSGNRTEKYRVGGDFILANDKGSNISFEDFAVAMVNEIELPQHSRKRFTVGY